MVDEVLIKKLKEGGYNVLDKSIKVGDDINYVLDLENKKTKLHITLNGYSYFNIREAVNNLVNTNKILSKCG